MNVSSVTNNAFLVNLTNDISTDVDLFNVIKFLSLLLSATLHVHSANKQPLQSYFRAFYFFLANYGLFICKWH